MTPTLAWRDRGNCRGAGIDMFPPAGDLVAMVAAKAVCDGCPVRAPCLDFAVTTNQEHGIWGGVGEYTRRKLRRDRRVAATRPPGRHDPSRPAKRTPPPVRPPRRRPSAA